MKPQPKRTIWADGYQAWFVNNQLHRTAGPAYIHADGTQEWWVNGQRHRTDGPAWIGSDGRQQWYMLGQNITEEVRAWQQQQGISWPWDTAVQTQFVMTFL